MDATQSTTGNASSKQHLVFGQVNDGGISPRKLHVLGVLHNFVVKRSDGSTAANRSLAKTPRTVSMALVKKIQFEIARTSAPVRVLGPAPPPIVKLRGHFRFHAML